MEFKTLFSILKKHLADGYDVPHFFRELMAMLTTVTEEEWGTNKDPSKKLSDETIRCYVKRGIPKKLASSIVYRLAPGMMVESINTHSKESRLLLADDLKVYDATLNAENVAEAISRWMVEIIRTAAGLIPQIDLERQVQSQRESDLKKKYGNYLMYEADGHCPCIGCGNLLRYSKDGKTAEAYSIYVIDEKKPLTPDNLLVMCGQCFTKYSLERSRKQSEELATMKRILEAHVGCVHTLDNLPLEKNIVAVIKSIKKLGENEITEALLDPSKINNKLSPSKEFVLYNTVRHYVTLYFRRIREIMISMDKRGDIDYEEIQNQVHAMYIRLKKQTKSRMDIFSEISDKIHRITLQDDTYCQIVVAYFIQSCEVFDAIAE